MSFGTAWDPHFGGLTRDESLKVLDAYFDAGGNFIDLANSYTDEQSEAIVGEWLQERGVRDRVVLATKFGMDYKFHEHGKNEVVNYGGNSKVSMHLSVRDSLKKLKTDWIDIFYLHMWDYTVGIEEMMDSLHLLVQQGKVLYLGISNAPAWFVSAANTYAKSHGKTPFSVYQGLYNVAQRDLESDIIPMSRAFGLGITAFNVLSAGKLKSKATIETREKSGEEVFRLLQSQTPAEANASAALEKVASELGAKVETVAIAWVMAKFPYVFPTLGMKRPEHVADAMEALRIRLSPEHIQALEEASPASKLFPMSILEDPANTGKLAPVLMAPATVDLVRAQRPIGYE
ncbi:Aldo-keto reductase ausK [Cladobotryum mycophilum]|uniref:Aldo-keto reductase ausK n=1 Tax=Cladobotryum mycophilum TaxID=491253 RepID=A0ABR0SMK2_9HYPO